MKANLHQKEFTTFIKMLADKYRPLYIYCFGVFTEADSKEGRFIETAVHENYQYCLWMVRENETRIEHQVADFLKTADGLGSDTIRALTLDAAVYKQLESEGEVCYG